MSLLSGLLQGQAPPKQDATSTIQTLCLRLSSGTLLEDRRAAILGLRSFARDYQELVASEGLRELIATLAKDRGDLDTVKAVLETLLTLFVRDEANVGIPHSSKFLRRGTDGDYFVGGIAGELGGYCVVDDGRVYTGPSYPFEGFMGTEGITDLGWGIWVVRNKRISRV
jgi:hypothetical protein